MLIFCGKKSCFQRRKITVFSMYWIQSHKREDNLFIFKAATLSQCGRLLGPKILDLAPRPVSVGPASWQQTSKESNPPGVQSNLACFESFLLNIRWQHEYHRARQWSWHYNHMIKNMPPTETERNPPGERWNIACLEKKTWNVAKMHTCLQLKPIKWHQMP